jgi:hypothetical protein
MMPVGRNHMWNAELKAQNYGDQFHGMYSFLYSPADRRQNEDNLRSFLEQAHHRMPLQSCDWNSDESRKAWVTICDHASVIDFLTRHRDVTTPERVRLLDFLKGDLHEIDDWVIAIPQQQPTFVWNGPAGLVIDGRERSQRGGIEDDMCRLVTLANEPERVSGRYIANESDCPEAPSPERARRPLCVRREDEGRRPRRNAVHRSGDVDSKEQSANAYLGGSQSETQRGGGARVEPGCDRSALTLAQAGRAVAELVAATDVCVSATTQSH